MDTEMNKVLYNIDQRPYTTEAERETARNNIGAAAAGDIVLNAGNGIQIGDNNTVSINSSGCYSVNTSLATGSANTCNGPRTVVAGAGNVTTGYARDSLVCGTDNRLTTVFSTVVAGADNQVGYAGYSLVAGEGARITGAARSSVIVGSATSGGNFSNCLVAGDGTKATGETNDCVILGYGNSFSGAINWASVHGSNNALKEEGVNGYARSCNNVLINGSNNYAYNVNKVIINGIRNYISGRSYDYTDGTIYTGDWHRCDNVRMSLVAGQSISATSVFRSILAGNANTNTASEIHDSLITGDFNVIDGFTTDSIIAGNSQSARGNRQLVTGRSNIVHTAEDSVILGVTNSAEGGNNVNMLGISNSAYYSYNTSLIGSANSASNTYRSIAIGEANLVAANDSMALGANLTVTDAEAIRVGFGGDTTNCFLHITRDGISAVKDGSAVPII